MFAAMRDFNRRRDATRNFNLLFDAEAPGWEDWLPPYRPGEPWPWRTPGADPSIRSMIPATNAVAFDAMPASRCQRHGKRT
jgi:hypothetical protein